MVHPKIFATYLIKHLYFSAIWVFKTLTSKTRFTKLKFYTRSVICQQTSWWIKNASRFWCQRSVVLFTKMTVIFVSFLTKCLLSTCGNSSKHSYSSSQKTQVAFLAESSLKAASLLRIHKVPAWHSNRRLVRRWVWGFDFLPNCGGPYTTASRK